MDERRLGIAVLLVTVGAALLFVGWTSRACTLGECPESAKHAPRLVFHGYAIGFSDGRNVCTLNTPAFLLGGASLLASVGTGTREAVDRRE